MDRAEAQTFDKGRSISGQSIQIDGAASTIGALTLAAMIVRDASEPILQNRNLGCKQICVPQKPVTKYNRRRVAPCVFIIERRSIYVDRCHTACPGRVDFCKNFRYQSLEAARN